jgi:hypothetical protein
MRSRAMLVLAVAVLVSACQYGGSSDASGPEPPTSSPKESELTLRAFQRAKRPSDVLRAAFTKHLHIVGGPIIDSRRVATHVDRRGRRATLFVAKSRSELCHVLVRSSSDGNEGFGASCSPRAAFFGDGRHVVAGSGRLFTGVVANDVARVVIVGSRGIRHPVKVTADGGFIYDCRAYNGCAGLIACVEAYGRDGALLSFLPWSAGGCRRR